MKVVIFGLTITSAWGNGHATTYRALVKALSKRGHQVTFIEKDVSWYRDNRDLHTPGYCRLVLFEDFEQSIQALLTECLHADAIVIGSYFPDAVELTRRFADLGIGPLLFYDIDTPITLAALRQHGRTDYLEASMLPVFAAYLSFTGGPVLRELATQFGVRRALPFYCSVDVDIYKPAPVNALYDCDLSYLGTYAPDRQAKLLRLLGKPAMLLPERSFLVAGAMYPLDTALDSNVRRITHVSPEDHPAFYSSSRYTLNLTRADMIAAGYSPSVRLFEASACGACILSDDWEGIDEFFYPCESILLPRDEHDVADILLHLSDDERDRIGRNAQERTMACHTSTQRAIEFEGIVSGLSS